jgi:hypothetical protein
MRYKLNEVQAVFKYGPEGSDDKELACIDIKSCYLNLGGKVSPETEVEFTTFFPGKPYEKTALTEKMPSTYLCEGSGSAIIYNPGSQPDAISVSVYRDTSKHSGMEEHHNIYLQYNVGTKLDHLNNIPERHIPLSKNVVIKPFIDGEEVKEETAVVK